MHIHQSVVDASTGANIFNTQSDEPSELFYGFLGGQQAHLPSLFCMLAPYVNSYRRFVADDAAPTNLEWDRDNRTTGLRIPVSSPANRRIENRIVGMDCNPYLAFAAALASGLDGIKNKIKPPKIFEGDIYAASHLPRVPYTLEEAVAKFEKSSFAKKAFGEKVMKHYTHYFKKEIEAYHLAVTDWERRRYFERI